MYNEDGSLNLNPNSLTVLDNCVVEPELISAKAYDSFQFVRNGFLLRGLQGLKGWTACI